MDTPIGLRGTDLCPKKKLNAERENSWLQFSAPNAKSPKKRDTKAVEGRSQEEASAERKGVKIHLLRVEREICE